jgi:hypothetical protein
MNQLSLFPELTEVKQDNLQDWAYEIGSATPLGKFLLLLSDHLPPDFIPLLEYRAGSDEDETAAAGLLYLDAWYKELAAFNMARLEQESA